MGERFPLRMIIGGDLPMAKASKLADELEAVCIEDEMGCLIDNVKDFMASASSAPESLTLVNNEMAYDGFDGVKDACRGLSLPYEFHCGASHAYLGDLEYWMPGMEKPQKFSTDPDGDVIVTTGRLEPLLERYYASVEDMKTDLRALVPSAPAVPDFRIID